MKKYVIKESELKTVIKEIIAEELSNLDEGWGRALGNTAKLAGVGAVSPLTLAQMGFIKANNLILGKDTLKSTVRDFVGPKQQKATQTDLNNVEQTYGKPETVAGLGKKLEKKMPITVDNFLGTDKNVNFGRHYYEVGQRSGANNTKWAGKLAEAQANVSNARRQNRTNRYVNQWYKQLKQWLEARDKAYEQYIRNRK